MEENSIHSASPQTPNVQPPKKKKHGCLIAALVFVIILGIAAAFSDDESSTNGSDVSEYANSDNATKGAVDSVKIKDFMPLFNEKTDEFNDVTWVKPKSAPQSNNATGFYTYFAKDLNGVPQNLRFVIQYAAKDWLFLESYVFLIDGKRYDFTPSDIQRDNSLTIWEWSDTGVSQSGEIETILKAIRNAKEVKVRFIGQQYHEDKTLTPSQIQSIIQPIEYYEALGGKF